ncbi:helix-turn-helix domain-containing protein [Phenylobacterium sp.]|jgi:transcriptional regulator with XRE-family HTH domain|uniref:helix-turn-helix domain-containing protein n=1 Tax=Phenylobacterium sp. TaxID=1871053 RepID=UPI002F9331D8
MPLDTVGTSEEELATRLIGQPEPPESSAPNVYSGANVGEALRLVREHQGRTLEEVAESTRVRRAYLAAIEELRLEQLPSRPFTIGYIRSYAEALGIDPEEAVYRFKADEPVLDEPLREPVGVHDDRDPRLSALIAGGVVILGAIVLWNVAQRAMVESAPPPPTASEQATAQALLATKAGPVSLGAPLPPPVESTTPAAYETPGLAEAGPDGMGNLAPPAVLGVTAPDAPPPDISSLPPVFSPKGKVYGAPADKPSLVTLQALRGAALIIRGADNSVYFARQLSKGEAYRVPAIGGLVIDVSDPLAFQVFVGAQSKGFLPARQASASGLAGAPATRPVVTARAPAPGAAAPRPAAPAPAAPAAPRP